MASTSRTCSDEELQKALADLHELVARDPTPDEFKFLCPEEEEYVKKKEEEEKRGKKKKKKLYRLLPKEVKKLLNYKGVTLGEHKILTELEEEDKEKYKDLRTLVTVADVFMRRFDDCIRANQEKLRHELLTKGYVTYEATDDEDEEDVTVPAAPQGARGGGGRRRHRPGVTKSAGGRVKKLN